MQNNVVNKKQYNKYFFLVLAVVLLIVAVTLVSLFGSKPVNASADTDSYEWYPKLVFSDNSGGECYSFTGLNLPYMAIRANEAGAYGHSDDILEYILKIDPYRFPYNSGGYCNYRSDNDVIEISFKIFSERLNYNTFTYFRLKFYYSETFPRVEFFVADDPPDYSNSGMFNVDFLGDLYFLTINNEGLFISTCSYYSENLLDARSDYDRSLDHIILSLDSNSTDFNVVTGLIARDQDSIFDLSYNDNNLCYYELAEKLSIYNLVKVPIKEGYKFVGWYYDKDFTRPYNNEVISSDTELYAKFEPITYTVFFDTGAVADPTDPNASGLYDTSIEVEYGGIVEYTPDVGDNKHLLGWFYADGTQYMNTPIYEDTRLYAKWGAYITFDTNGSNETIDPWVCELGQRYEFPKLVRDEYDFVCWESVGVAWREGDPILYDMDLIAVWEKNVFLVTFYVDDEIFAEVKVNKGERLNIVFAETISEDKVVVGYENLNSYTEAVQFDEFEIYDDVAVYLTDHIEEDSSAADENASTGVLAKIKSFFSSIKDFFVKIGNFFKKCFDWIKNLFSKRSNIEANVLSDQPGIFSAVGVLSETAAGGIYEN